MRQVVAISAVGFRDFSNMIKIAEWAVCSGCSGEQADQEEVCLVFSKLGSDEFQVWVSVKGREGKSRSLAYPAPKGVSIRDWLHDLRSFTNCLFVIGGWRISEERNAGKDTLIVTYQRDKS